MDEALFARSIGSKKNNRLKFLVFILLGISIGGYFIHREIQIYKNKEFECTKKREMAAIQIQRFYRQRIKNKHKNLSIEK